MDFIVLGGNPGSGTSIEDVMKQQISKEICGDDISCLLAVGRCIEKGTR
ncbi:MAG: hypothetical protein ACLRWM_09405 [Streptococcus sp.]